MRGLWKRLGSGRMVMLSCVWLTLVFAVIIFGPEDIARPFAYLLLASWAFAGLVAYATGLQFGHALRQHAPDVATQIDSGSRFLMGQSAFRQRATLSLAKAVRTDQDLGPTARVHAVAFWYPLVLFVLAVPGFAWMAQR